MIKSLVSKTIKLHTFTIHSRSIVLKIVSIAIAFLLISACGSETSSDKDLSEPTIPTNQIQPYLLGDMIKFSGVIRISKIDEPIFISNVTVLVEFEQSKLDYLNKNVLGLRTITTYLATGEQQIETQNIWQEANGELFELSDKYGNEYVVGAAFEKGLFSIPLPLNAFDDINIDFHSVYAGPSSVPITEGKREISVAPMQTVETVLGKFQTYNITHKESYKYLFTYAGNKSGTTIITQRKIWVSRYKGIVKKIQSRRIYAISGALLSEAQLELEIVSTSLGKA
ncbi:MAG: hypothetical protein ACI89W_000718 [Gammaproteobacteria bacterium]|jgi:hypothetical protein